MPVVLLDVAIVMTALAACMLWFRASQRKVRRISRREDLDHADFNRIVTALNRSQILNGQAALVTGVATGLAGLRVMAEYAA